MLSNAYFVAKFRFDTAENESGKNLQKFRKMHFSKMHFPKMHFDALLAAAAEGGDLGELVRRASVFPWPGRDTSAVAESGRGERPSAAAS